MSIDPRRMDDFSDEKILDSWKMNSSAWTGAVRGNQIESRKLVTNEAIIDAVLARSPKTALDIGCGEGWLSRVLSRSGIAVTGVDAVPSLIESAMLGGGGEFMVATYEELASGSLALEVDVAVANFSFIGRESVDAVIRASPSLLNPGGALIVQTLHPHVACGEAPYEDGWRAGSWAGCGDDFTDPAPWFFRTLESWVELLLSSSFELCEIREPVHPVTGRPASVIFVAVRRLAQ